MPPPDLRPCRTPSSLLPLAPWRALLALLLALLAAPAFADARTPVAKGGVIEALDRAKAKGLVRFVGFTGHKDPALHLQMLV